MSIDTFKKMYEMQEAFMKALQDSSGIENFPDWPLDLSQKKSQQLCKSLAYDSTHELHEAITILKNSKPHRKTDVSEFDYEGFKEELVDAFKFYLEILIFAGISPDDFFEAYLKKDAVIHERIKNGY